MSMWIIPSAANEDGGRSNMQKWNGATPTVHRHILMDGKKLRNKV